MMDVMASEWRKLRSPRRSGTRAERSPCVPDPRVLNGEPERAVVSPAMAVKILTVLEP